MTMKLFKLKTKIRRAAVKTMNLNRPTAFPFITGDGFRSFAEHFFDEISNFEPGMVRNGDVIFVRGDFLHEFFKTKHPLIKDRYLLISNNGDTNITPIYEKYLDDKIIHWFGQNVTFNHEKITPTPIGLTNTFCNHIGTLAEFKKIIEETRKNEKNNAMTYGFSLISHSERLAIHTSLSQHKNAREVGRRSQSDYFKEISKYKFIVSPEGNGADCHRTWEAIYLNIVPIVKKSCFTEYFRNLGLPILVVNDWKELESFDELFLAKKYEELKSRFGHPAMCMSYWMDLVFNS